MGRGADEVSSQGGYECASARSFWTGIKTSDRAKFQVTTCRCAGCGYLESYALFAQE